MVGAILDAGWPEERMRAILNQLSLDDAAVEIETRLQHGIEGRGILVKAAGEPPARSFKDVREILSNSSLEPAVKEKSIALFERLAQVEGAIHGSDPEDVHFHELGAIDSIVDIVLTVAGLEGLGIDRLSCGSIPLSRGEVETAHGKLPVPAPATLRLLEGLPIHWLPISGEWLTPTGALILKGLVDEFGPPPGMTLGRVGIGAGSRSSPDRANIVRLLVGEESSDENESAEWISVLETNIDDLDPRHEASVAARLMEKGALDVLRLPAQMKKGRKGTVFTVLCRAEDEERLGSILLRETTTLGIRIRREYRRVLKRWVETVETPYGPVRVKWSRPGGVVRPVPEFDDLEARAGEAGVPTWQVEQAALRAFHEVDLKEPPAADRHASE